MQKQILTLSVFALFSFTAVNATPTVSNCATEIRMDDEKVQLKMDELPEAIKQALSADEYAEWKPETIHKVKTETGSEWYEVEFRKEEQKTIVKFDKEGKKVE